MRKIAVTNKYKKDLELAKRRHLPMDELNGVIYNLANCTTCRMHHSANGSSIMKKAVCKDSLVQMLSSRKFYRKASTEQKKPINERSFDLYRE